MSKFLRFMFSQLNLVEPASKEIRLAENQPNTTPNGIILVLLWRLQAKTYITSTIKKPFFFVDLWSGLKCKDILCCNYGNILIF